MRAKLNALVLAGGKSTRMGTDKGAIEYQGKPHREYLYQLLQELCDDVYLSIRSEQKEDLSNNFKTIIDKNDFKGPMNGMMSAHQQFPDVAWLVVATDLPLVDKNSIENLIENRNPNKVATAYATHESKLPEPVFAIWEPHAFTKALEYLKDGLKTCPRKFLINNETQLIFPTNDEVLINANTKEDYNFALEKLKEK